MRLSIRGLLALSLLLVTARLGVAQCPAPGTCASPIVVPAAGGELSGTTTDGGSALTGSCGGTTSTKEKVYRWTPNFSGVATIATCGEGTNFDTVVYLRTNCTAGPDLACNDDACFAASRITPTVTAGQPYYVVVDGFGGNQGNFGLSVWRNWKFVFVTSTTHAGNLGGLAGADSICAARAAAAGLPGTYKAWLSNTLTSAASRLTHAIGPYQRTDGVVVANDWTDLTNGSLAAPISSDEFGTAVSTPVAAWTATDPDGSSEGAGPNSVSFCCEWTCNLNFDFGQYGLVYATITNWTANGDAERVNDSETVGWGIQCSPDSVIAGASVARGSAT